jgi:23S rRNA pseudouridine2457 synthase
MSDFILHKPFGYTSQFVRNQPTRRNKKLLGELYDFPEGTMAIGRLDEASEGLLLLTTDGKLSQKIRSKNVEKEYFVELDGQIDAAAIERLREGVSIRIRGGSYPAKAVAVKPIDTPAFPERRVPVRKHRPTSWISIVLNEGKNRQVRKMCAAVGFPVLRLLRVRIGGLELGDFVPGRVVEVKDGFGEVFGEEM